MYVNDCAEAIRRITERGEFGQVSFENILKVVIKFNKVLALILLG